MKKAVQIKVTGKVQNVGFRFYTVKAAQHFNIGGFVKNEPDGSVYIEAEGDEDALEYFISWCSSGPQWSRVEQIKVFEQPLSNYKGFQVK